MGEPTAGASDETALGEDVRRIESRCPCFHSPAFALPDGHEEASIRLADIALVLPVAFPRTWLLAVAGAGA